MDKICSISFEIFAAFVGFVFVVVYVSIIVVAVVLCPYNDIGNLKLVHLKKCCI